MKSRALLFGLNYAHEPSATLNGCINDVQNMGKHLQAQYPKMIIDTYSDDTDLVNTSGHGMIQRLYELAIKSHSEHLDFVYIHYSGHGSYIKDTSGDEADGKDECLVPSDFAQKGLIVDDIICSVFAHFNPETRVVCVFDCCHSATVGDVKFSWDVDKIKIENSKCSVKAKILTLSGCLDDQTSADAFNVLHDNKFAGALTSCILMTLLEKNNADAFELLQGVKSRLQSGGYTQIPRLCSTYNILDDKVFLP